MQVVEKLGLRAQASMFGRINVRSCHVTAVIKNAHARLCQHAKLSALSMRAGCWASRPPSLQGSAWCCPIHCPALSALSRLAAVSLPIQPEHSPNQPQPPEATHIICLRKQWGYCHELAGEWTQSEHRSLCFVSCHVMSRHKGRFP